MMIKKVVFMFSSVIFAFFLSGCGGNMPPKCDSKEVKKLFIQLIEEEMVELGLSDVKVKATGHRMLEEHKDAKEYTCEARVILTEDGQTESEVIGYSVFLDDNKKGQFYVQINE